MNQTSLHKSNKVDMINGPLAGKILKVAIPLAAISILQQLFNAADVAVVGKFASDTAMAAVGANTPIINIFITFFTGMATGGNVAISTLIGRGEHKKISDAVHTVFTISLIGASLIILLGQLLAVPILNLVNTPENVLNQAVLYLRIYIFAMFFSVIYNFASAILRSKGDTKRPLYCLIASGIINVGLNLLFVLGLGMDVAGVALATVISNFICASATVIILLREEGPLKISFKKLGIKKEPLTYTLRIGLPSGIQGMLFSVSNVMIQSGINHFGSDCVSGNTAALNFEYITYYFVSAFSQTSTTFTSQNYGAGKMDRVKKIFFICLGLAIVASFGTSLIFVGAESRWLRLFTDKREILDYAVIRMHGVVFWEFLTAFSEMGSAGMRGMGIAVPPMIISISGSCLLRLIWISTVFKQYDTINALLFVYPFSWILLTVFMVPTFWIMYSRRRRSMIREEQTSIN